MKGSDGRIRSMRVALDPWPAAPPERGMANLPVRSPLFQGEAEACGVRIIGGQRHNQTCRRRAGWGTEHIGYGPCKDHE